VLIKGFARRPEMDPGLRWIVSRRANEGYNEEPAERKQPDG
jgi:hypothetical protein